jgi:hypothetical protein
VQKDSDALSGASVADNANDWIFCQNGVMLYVEYIKITVSGTLKGHWYWETPLRLLNQYRQFQHSHAELPYNNDGCRCYGVA